MRRFFECALVLAGLFASISNAFAWGQKGHDVTCAVAERHLTKKAAKKVSELLDGKSIVYWANWMDNASHTPEYSYTSTWHYKNIDADETFAGAELNPNGDVVVAINKLVEDLKGGKLGREEEVIALRMLVHLVGDLHCPMHMGHKSDRGGNKWQVNFFGNNKNLHSVWDSDIVERAHKWSYSEWADQVDRANKKEAKAIVCGTPETWGAETFALTTAVYEDSPVGSKLYYDYVNQWAPVIEQQFMRGGLRLAALLNEIYG